MVTKINREQTIKWILVLSTVLIVVSMAIILTQPSQIIDEPTYDPIIIQYHQDISNNTETTCNWSNHHDPNEFHRIYY
jgi:hypothetical protein